MDVLRTINEPTAAGLPSRACSLVVACELWLWCLLCLCACLLVCLSPPSRLCLLLVACLCACLACLLLVDGWMSLSRGSG
mmetsp:Transcript_4465/g.14298  ORF Transcript_4465/g.14298 Transcript_4465/m.14298 type:complete len:80 (-) Transcript_4465:10-249(-)